jgi:iron complex outermembrane receptor protein
MRHPFGARQCLAGAVALLAAMSLAWAGGESTAAAPDGSSAGAVLEEVTVTAQRVEQNLERVPISVTAASGKELEDKGVTDLNSIVGAIPNLQIGSSPVGGNAAAQVYVRGVGQISYTATQEADVPIYVDGVYIARPIASVFDLIDVDRVEVLRGPQGTLFGRNALGGAVQIITQEPTQTFGGFAEVVGGSYGRRDLDAAFNTPLTDTLSARITASHREDGGYTRSLSTGIDGNNTNDNLVRGQLRWQPDDATDVLLRGDYMRHDANPALETLVGLTNTPTLAFYNSELAALGLTPITPAMISSNPYQSYSGLRTPDTSQVEDASLTASRNLGSFAIKSITALRDVAAESGFDFSATPYPLIYAAGTSTRERQITEELQAYGKAFGNLTWIGGLYYFHEHNIETQNDIIGQSVVITGPGPYDFVPATGPGSAVADEQLYLNQITDSYAAYGQVTWELPAHWQLVIGGRESWDRKILGSEVGFVTPGDVRPYGTERASWSQFTPKGGINYEFSADVLGYLSASKGYRAGGFNGLSTDPRPPNVYGAESLWDYEFGVKGDYLSHRLRLNVGAFYYDYKNYQANVNVVDPATGTVGVNVANAASEKLYGTEIEMQLRATQAIALGLYATVEHMDFYNIVPGAITSVTAQSQPPNAPKFTGGANASYRYSLGDWGAAVLRGDYSYRSKTEFFLPNFPGEAQGGYGLANVRMTLIPDDDRYELALFGTNIFGKARRTYAQSLAASIGTIVAEYGPPAQWGASLTVKF